MPARHRPPLCRVPRSLPRSMSDASDPTRHHDLETTADTALLAPHLIPSLDARMGGYRVRFARTESDLEAVRRLRYAVFNVELGEGLNGSHETGLDADAFDRQCQHLMVLHEDAGAVVGTYRMQTAASAVQGHGWYTAGEFEIGRLPREVLDGAAELGRACVARPHRDRNVLFLLWHGLIEYARHTGVRAYFGCSSLTGTDPELGISLYAHLLANGHLHEELHVPPRLATACPLLDWPIGDRRGQRTDVSPPRLFATYLRHGAKILGPPAIDREFGTIDFLTWIEITKRHARLFGSIR